jgi:quercetin dioxygenase-like cupin family protein
MPSQRISSTMKRLAVAFGVSVAILAVAAAARGTTQRSADTPHGVHLTPLSTGTFGGSVRADGAGVVIKTHGRKQMLTSAITVDPGGSFGWHSHPGPVLVAIGRGTLTEYHPEHGRCMRSTVSAGQAFTESGGVVHLARNETSQPVELNAIFFAKPGVSEFLIAAQRPRGCTV